MRLHRCCAVAAALHAVARAQTQSQSVDGAGAATAAIAQRTQFDAAPRRRLARRTRKTSARGLPGAAVRALAGDVMSPETNALATTPDTNKCVFHLHTPKCAGTFVWRFFRDKFCEEAETCKRGTLRVPPACLCAGNPITDDDAVLNAIKRGAYRFVSAHSRQPFSDKCALAVWFREPVSRVRSHYGYVVHRRRRNVTLSSLLASRKPPNWVSNQQWSLFLPGSRVAGSQAPSSTQLTEASSELQRAAFVGLVEQMDVSLCRFARAYLQSHSTELCARGAGGRRENVGRRPSADARETELLERVNRFDAALYELAVAEFARRGSGVVVPEPPPAEFENVWEVRTDGLDVVE